MLYDHTIDDVVDEFDILNDAALYIGALFSIGELLR